MFLGRLIFVVVIFGLIVLPMVVYLFKRFRKLLPGHWAKALLPMAVLVIAGFVDFVNTLVVAMHLTVFWLVCDLIVFIFKKISGKSSKIHWQGIAAIILCAVYLGIGAYNAYSVAETDYRIVTEKDIGTDRLRIAQISDSHVGTTFDGEGFAEHMKDVQAANPDIVVITGDFVDDNSTKADMIRSCQALGELQTKYGVYMIYGNHDKGYWDNRDFSWEELDEELTKNNVGILKDESLLIDNRFYLVGRKDKSDRERSDIGELTRDLDSSKYMIVLDHQPNDYDAEAEAGADLVLSGHTHGGQMVPVGQISVWTGINDSIYGEQKRENTTFIVNSGISDWMIKFKTGTFSEYGIIDVSRE